MTEKVTKKVIEKKSDQKPETKPVVAVAEQPKSKFGLGFIILVFLIIIVSMVGFYFINQLNNEQEIQQTKFVRENERVLSLTKQLTSIQAQLASTQKLLTTVDADVTSTDDVFTNKLAEFSKTNDAKLKLAHADLKESILKLQRQLGKTRGDWLMADAEYLLSIANQRLHLIGDIKTTAEALKAADERLHESGDGATFKIREQITKEIASLKEISVHDIVGSYARLKSLIDSVDRLTLILPYAEKPLKTDDRKLPEKADGIVEVVLQQIDGYVTVRHNDGEVKKILSHEEAKLIKQQLGLKLEIIKIALVQENTALYESTMTDALEWIKQHFIINKISKTFLNELNELKKSYVNTELPDISISLKMLRDITKLRIETDKGLQDEAVKKSAESDEKNPEKSPEALKNNEKPASAKDVTKDSPIKPEAKPAIKADEKPKNAPDKTSEATKKTKPIAVKPDEKVTTDNPKKESAPRVSPQQ